MTIAATVMEMGGISIWPHWQYVRCWAKGVLGPMAGGGPAVWHPHSDLPKCIMPHNCLNIFTKSKGLPESPGSITALLYLSFCYQHWILCCRCSVMDTSAHTQWFLPSKFPCTLWLTGCFTGFGSVSFSYMFSKLILCLGDAQTNPPQPSHLAFLMVFTV